MGPETDPMSSKIKELLNEVVLDHSTTKTLDRIVSSITDAIKSIPNQEVSPDYAPAFIRDVKAPSDKVHFTFRSPDSVQIGGSHSIRCVAKPNINVDLLVRMPKECFFEKDFLNHLYHAKRCLYLRVVESSLKSSPAVRDIKWSTFQDEARKPLLIVYPVTEIAELSGVFIRIIPTATSLFEVSKLNLTRNNVRSFNEGGVLQATPKYSSSILEDMFLEENAEFVKQVFLEWNSLQEALGLLKQRQIYGARVFFFGLQASVDSPRRTRYVQLFRVVLIDASGHVNLTFRMTRSAFSELQDEAAWTLNCLDKCRDSGFEEIFITKVDCATKFDYCLRINLKGNVRVSASDYCMDDERWRICQEDVSSLLKQSLSDRVNLVRVTWRSTPSEWDVDDIWYLFF